MRILFSLLFIVFSGGASATNYYISSIGNDSNNGSSVATPWKTISKLNTFTGLVAGDAIFFKRGETFYGTITVNNSGNPGSSIIFGAYGTGANPIITGFTNVTAWTNLGSNIWESTSAISSLSTCNLVVINGANTPMGRYPNTGWLTYQSHSGVTSITSSSLSGNPNWTGAQLVMRSIQWMVEVNPITAQSGGTLTYKGGSSPGTDGYGFFIQNDARTLDKQDEWYFNPSTKKVRIYSTSIPTSVQIPTLDQLVIIPNHMDYITFDHIDFIGANTNLIEDRQGKYITIQNCSFKYAMNGISTSGAYYGTIVNIIGNTFSNCNNHAFYNGDYGARDNISYNNIDSTGMVIGGWFETDQNSGDALRLFGTGSIAQYNRITNTGHHAIVVSNSDGITASYNYISNFGMTRYDAGGVYSWNQDSTTATSRIIDHNIVVDSKQTSDGIGTDSPSLFGIYIDGNSKNTSITNNTVYNCIGAGILILNSGSVTLSNNTCYDNKYQLSFTHAHGGGMPITGLRVNDNILISKTTTQTVFYFRDDDNLLFNKFGISDNNYFARPMDDNLTTKTVVLYTETNRSVGGWQAFSGQDAHSKKSPKAITDINDLRFEYNASGSSVAIALDGSYIDVKDTLYNGSVTLAPYTSVALIRNGPIINPPKANAGNDQIITLPLDSINLSGSGSSSNGTISSYKWTKISGPANFSIVKPASAITEVTGLAKGVYQFELTVTDSNGFSGKDTIQITVKAANIPPVANAGQDQTITLPTNTLTLAGNGTDSDGNITTYLWTKISGPSSYAISNPGLVTTSVTGLEEGIYEFALRVTDNDGATDTDTLRVIVNPAPNQSPVVNAGPNQTITLPSNTLSLTGNASDPDGTVVSYVWTKVAGPSVYNILYEDSASTDVTGLVKGIYQFQLEVIDNDGAKASDVVVITVLEASNASPVADAGADQTVTLPVNTVLLTGSGNDSDGTVVSYAWTKISGPLAYNILYADSAATTVTGLTQGIYQFQLEVTDDKGAKGNSLIEITVNSLANISPVADAGVDQIITLPVDTIVLTGSGYDQDGTITSYNWTKISGPSNYTIANSVASSTKVTGLIPGVYQFQLETVDNNGASGTDIVQVTVNPAQNIPPTANAGPDQTVTLPSNSLKLSGIGNDMDGSIVSYQWTKISGPSNYNIADSTSAVTDITVFKTGIYQFELTVTDNNGATGTDVVQISVNGAINIPPVADAGIDQAITLPINNVSVVGIASDADGTISNYNWIKISGPAQYNIVSPGSLGTDITGLVEGVYQFQLNVVDDKGAIGTDMIKVTVNPAPNQPPVANAGSDKIITLPVNSVKLIGTGSDPDGAVIKYFWTKISGPSTYSIVDTTSATTDITGLVQGVYQFQLETIDNNGASGTDIVQVTVNPAQNIPPTANAGPDQTVTLPSNSLKLSGIGNDMDGSIVSYQWTKISGPSNYNIADSTSAVTDITVFKTGIYQFELTVTDNNGATGTDVVQISVNGAINIPPVADAGIDQAITLPINNVSVVGIASDADGTISNYNWIKISGPAQYNIVSPGSLGTDITGLVEGVYQFQLNVVDDKGAIGTDMIKVTVNPAPNQPPVANAGSDKIITLPVNSVKLIGTGSDPDGAVIKYFWTKISGPSTYSIVDTTSATTDITGLVQGVYQFQLETIDNNGASGTDIVQVTVNPAQNIPPTANAGPDQTVTLPSNSLKLSGIGNDMDGSIVSYQWTKISGPSNYNIADSTSAVTDITVFKTGIYQFELTVTDNNGATGTDVVQISVNGAINIPPVADAGIDQAITLPINNVSVVGIASDADGTISNYNWIKISGPAQYNIVSPGSLGTDITGLVEGVYQFQLNVVDDKGAIGTDMIKVTVNPAPNQPPVANAGSDKIITLPVNSVKLIGTGSDPDGAVIKYFWTKISGPSTYSIVDTTSATTDITGLVQGVYQFQLEVSDDKGAIGSDNIKVIVNAAPNQPPVANAGIDKIITLPTNLVTLSGSGSDADGTITSYEWIKISGPSNYQVANPNTAATNITNLTQGIYQFELKVTDDKGATATDIVNVTVNPAPNQPPVANAGADQVITLPINSVSLLGSGVDSDGKIAGYTWSKISGPSGYNITSTTSAATDITNLVQGVYQFELKVIDDDGARTRDSVKVTVNAAANISPSAFAGPSQTIVLPVNTVSLSGSGSDPDGTIVSYLWSKISGPSSFNIVNVTSPVTDIWGLEEGVYQLQLKVIDNNGAVGMDTMLVTVSPGNVLPVADAGPDQTITLPITSVKLSGSGTAANGFIQTYSWKQISGPSPATITDQTNPLILASDLQVGNYKFELTVVDNLGSMGKDTVIVVVAAPRLNASVQTSEIKVYPNPVVDITTLEINTSQIDSKLEIIIVDMRNHIVYKNEITATRNNILQTIDMTNMTKGTYVVTVYFDDGKKQSIKIVRL